jgi:LPXTG-motif cell wall-anchored protein
VFTKRQFVLLIVLITSLILNAQAAKVYGTIYEWSDFDNPLKNAIVEIEENHTRLQYKISGDGTYSFDISPGNYIIKAKYYNNNILDFSGEEKLQIDKPDESRNLDILLFPPTDSEYEYLGDINLTGEIDANESGSTDYIIIMFAGLFILLIILFYIRKRKKKPVITDESEPTPEPPGNKIGRDEKNNTELHTELPDDLKELYEIILKKGGRITQKDLRKEVIYGEAKVSLMIADLEDRGLIKKIKRGRSNIIIAENKK